LPRVVGLIWHMNGISLDLSEMRRNLLRFLVRTIGVRNSGKSTKSTPQPRTPSPESLDLIDVLHSILLLWETSKRDKMVELLKESGYG